MSNYCIAVDAMGGDYGPLATIPAVVQQAVCHPDVQFIVFVQQDTVLETTQFLPINLELRLAERAISMNETPATALRYGRNSSMALALQALKRGEVNAVITSGNTGALVALSHYILGMQPSIDRPALCKILPTHLGQGYLLDLGATVNCSAKQLVQFARLGAALRHCFQSDSLPKVHLLNIGSEHFKGMDSIRDAARMLGDLNAMDYQGFIEGDALYQGAADIIVCDGFVGNIALKVSEGTARFMVSSLQSVLANTQSGASRVALANWHSQADPDRHNGAYLLGVKGLIVKSHGASDAKVFGHALAMLVEQSSAQKLDKFAEGLAKFS
jgi:glycerol-3-phosphate acyltransferase PlsX